MLQIKSLWGNPGSQCVASQDILQQEIESKQLYQGLQTACLHLEQLLLFFFSLVFSFISHSKASGVDFVCAACESRAPPTLGL